MNSRSVAAAAVRKNLGPDPSMGRKVELLRRLVSMRQADMRRGPVAKGLPVRRPSAPSGRPRGGPKDPGFGFRPRGM